MSRPKGDHENPAPNARSERRPVAETEPGPDAGMKFVSGSNHPAVIRPACWKGGGAGVVGKSFSCVEAVY